MTAQTYQNTPGSDQAVADGCTCAVLDNAHGKGCGYVDAEGRACYIVDMTCALHGGAEMFPVDAVFSRDDSEPSFGAAARMDGTIR